MEEVGTVDRANRHPVDRRAARSCSCASSRRTRRPRSASSPSAPGSPRARPRASSRRSSGRGSSSAIPVARRVQAGPRAAALRAQGEHRARPHRACRGCARPARRAQRGDGQPRRRDARAPSRSSISATAGTSSARRTGSASGCRMHGSVIGKVVHGLRRLPGARRGRSSGSPPDDHRSGRARRATSSVTRARGYATAVDELEPGLWAIAAPVFDAGGTVIAALCVSGPDRPPARRPARRARPTRPREAATLSARSATTT